MYVQRVSHHRKICQSREGFDGSSIERYDGKASGIFETKLLDIEGLFRTIHLERTKNSEEQKERSFLISLKLF